jgi:hypothetical protein
MVEIINRYKSEQNIRAERIVRRIIRYAPKECLIDLNEIELLDRDTINNCFASYSRSNRKIELFIGDIIGWQPWILRKSYILTYLAIGIALGHEIDHHVNRDTKVSDKEKSAENNALSYIYPSFGFFKPLARLYSRLAAFVIR